MDVEDVPTEYVLAGLLLLASISVDVVSMDYGGSKGLNGTRCG